MKFVLALFLLLTALLYAQQTPRSLPADYLGYALDSLIEDGKKK